MALLLALSLVRGFLYLAVVPPWQGPDEPRHFEYARLIADRRRLVTMRDLSPALQADVLHSMADHDFWRFGFAYYDYDPTRPPRTFEEVWPGDFAHQVHQPALYYVGAAIAALLAPGNDVQLDLYAMRFYSLLVGLLTLIVVYRAAAELFPEDAFLRLAIPAFVALLPMNTFLMSMVSNDALAELLVSVMVWRTIRLLRLGFTPARAAEVMLWAVLAIFSKLTALVAIPIALIGILLAWNARREAAEGAASGLNIDRPPPNPPPFHGRGRGGGYPPPLRGGGQGWGQQTAQGRSRFPRAARWLLAVIALGVAGLLLLLSAGSEHPLWSAPARFLRIPRDVALYLTGGDYARALLTTPYGTYLVVMFRSFWGLFGWLNVPMAAGLYWFLGGVTALAALGLARGFLRARRVASLPPSQAFVWQRQAFAWQWRALWLCALSPVLAVTIVLGKEVLFLTYLEGGLPHGRYLFPVILPIACLFVLGLREWVPGPKRGALLVGLLAGLFLLDAWALWGTIYPFYYG